VTIRQIVVGFLLASGTLCADAPSRLIYSRAFPGSTPEYFRILIESTGDFQYTEAPDDSQPLHARLNDADVATLFEMATALDHFKTPLESGLKVANTGKKIFRFETPQGVATETEFNYSLNVTAQKLLDKLEQIASSERAYLDLDRTVHFDKLGVNDSLAQIESLWLRKQLAAPDQFIPLLTRISTHSAFMHLARDRAARLKEEFSKPLPAASASAEPQHK